VERAPRAAPTHDVKPEDRSRERVRLGVTSIVIVAAVFAQDAGRIAADTKLDLALAPARFLGRALHLWSPDAAFGQLQNQAYGYFFPMGPFFAAAHAVGVPAWVTQRLWQSALLLVAMFGMRLLARRLGIGTPGTQLLAGVVFALTPMVLSKVGPISSEALVECLAPWVLVPLVGARATAFPRAAACRSGVAVLFAGGINAAATIALLPLPALWLLTRAPGATRRRLIRWWLLAVVLACLWWAVPLVELGRYSPAFLDWIEPAAVTTHPTGLLPTLSGNEHWLAYLPPGFGSSWRGGHLLVTNRLAVVDAAVLAGLGLLGLLRRDLPNRRFLVFATVLGIALVTFGHTGSLGPWAAGPEQRLLDGALAPLRNVHKFDLVLRVPLVLAIAHLATMSNPMPIVRRGTAWVAAPAAAVVAVIALAGVAMPVWRGAVEPRGTFASVPDWWSQAATYLDTHDDGSRALVLPGAGHAVFDWGDTQDEPLEALARSRWAVRDLVPLGGAGEARLLDGLDDIVSSGRGSSGLSGYLARAGVGWIVLRHDLDPASLDIEPPLAVRSALATSPGITRVAAFGPLTSSMPMLEIYRVNGAAPRLEALPVAGTVRVQGGVESLLPLITHGLLPPTSAVVLAGNADAGVPEAHMPLVVTDGNRRIETSFARVTDNKSATRYAGQPWSEHRPVHDYHLPGDHAPQAVAVVYGAKAIRASSSAADADAFWLFGSEHSPDAAFDGDPKTTWVSGGASAVGQWVQADYVSPLPADTQVDLSAAAVQHAGPPATAVRVSTDKGSFTAPVGPTARAWPLPGPTRRVRVTILNVIGGGDGDAASVEVGVTNTFPVQRGLAVPAPPDPQPSKTPTFVFTGRSSTDGCLGPGGVPATVCNPAWARHTEDDVGIDRAFTEPVGSSDFVGATARLLGGPALDAVLPHPRGLRITVSSHRLGSAVTSAVAMVDGDRHTTWIAGSATPTVTLAFAAPRLVTGLTLNLASQSSAAAPRDVVVHAHGRTEPARVQSNGLVALPAPLLTKELRLTFPAAKPQLDAAGEPVRLGISELHVTFADGTRSHSVVGATSIVTACGSGPDIRVDDAVVHTGVLARLSDVVHDRDVLLAPCPASSGVVPLLAGPHRVRAAATALALPTAVTLRPSLESATPPTIRSIRVEHTGPGRLDAVVSGGAASWLALAENANPGWQATYGGTRLRGVVLDGWRQGFLLPAGDRGPVSIRYAPDRTYRRGLAAGAVAALLLLLLGARRSRTPAELVARPRRPTVVRVAGVASMVVLALATGPIGTAIVIGVAIAVEGVHRWRGDDATRSFAQALAVAGLAVAVTAALVDFDPVRGSTGAQSWLAQVGCVVALAVTVLRPERGSAP
jgi:arabinofuranan 3-O-arabinosyltransferase